MDLTTVILNNDWKKGDVFVRVGLTHERYGDEFEFSYFLLDEISATQLDLKEVKFKEEFLFENLEVGGDHNYFYRRVGINASTVQAAVQSAREQYRLVLSTMMLTKQPGYNRNAKELTAKLAKIKNLDADANIVGKEVLPSELRYGRVPNNDPIFGFQKKTDVVKTDEWGWSTGEPVEAPVEIEPEPETVYVAPKVAKAAKAATAVKVPEGTAKVHGCVNPRIVCRTELELGKHYAFWEKPFRTVLNVAGSVVTTATVRQKIKDGGAWKVDVVEVVPNTDGSYQIVAKAK